MFVYIYSLYFDILCFNAQLVPEAWTVNISFVEKDIETLIVSTVLLLLLLLLLFLQNCCRVNVFLLKPLKSNFLQFLEQSWTGQCLECKVPRKWLIYTDHNSSSTVDTMSVSIYLQYKWYLHKYFEPDTNFGIMNYIYHSSE